MRDSPFGIYNSPETLNYTGRIFKLSNPSLDLDVNGRSILIFDQVSCGSHHGEEIMILYHDFTLEFHCRHGNNGYINVFSHKLGIRNLVSFSYNEDEGLYFYEKINDIYQLSGFKYESNVHCVYNLVISRYRYEIQLCKSYIF